MTRSPPLQPIGDGRGAGFLHDTFDNTAIGLGVISAEGRWLRVNALLCEKLGFSPRELAGQNFTEIFDPQDATAPILNLRDATTRREANLRCRRKDGSTLWTTVTITPAGAPKNYFICSMLDIQLLKAAEESLAMERRLMVQQLRMQSAVFNATQEGMLIIGADDHIISCNPAFTEITDYASSDIRGRHISFLFSGHNGQTGWATIKSSLARHGHWAGESGNRRKGGEVALDWTTIHALKDDTGRLLNYVLTSVDISRMKHASSEIGRLAFSDPLTGLPNRTLLMNRLNHALCRAKRNITTGAVMYIDLDGFKAVNDRYGHHTGDELLKQAGARLKGRLREVDTVARIGSDEFIAVLEDVRKPEGIGIVASALISTLSTQFNLPEDISVNISGSIGVATFADGGPDATTILAQADRALYIAKNAGRACYRMDQQGVTIN
jgi:diguanylate cyclase (GGDEF)-like protein/PAS domain S-box-containing protein